MFGWNEGNTVNRFFFFKFQAALKKYNLVDVI